MTKLDFAPTVRDFRGQGPRTKKAIARRVRNAEATERGKFRSFRKGDRQDRFDSDEEDDFTLQG
jgi:hypothetical protein